MKKNTMAYRAGRPLALILSASLVLCIAFPSLPLAGSLEEAKKYTSEIVERNADQLALLGDSLFYFGELGMPELDALHHQGSSPNGYARKTVGSLVLAFEAVALAA